jgi:NADH-quinone oxidoreductase subunit C
MLSFEDLIDFVKKHSTAEVLPEGASTPRAIRIDASELVNVCTALQQDPSTYFDMLSCITGIDNGVDANTMEVIYTLYSIPFNTSLNIKVRIPRSEPVIPSVAHLWKTADWHEREIYDLLGIQFEGHPDLRRILLPADWIGHPLRKDYKVQEYYHGIKFDY